MVTIAAKFDDVAVTSRLKTTPIFTESVCPSTSDRYETSLSEFICVKRLGYRHDEGLRVRLHLRLLMGRGFHRQLAQVLPVE